eukprot:530938_1
MLYVDGIIYNAQYATSTDKIFTFGAQLIGSNTTTGDIKWGIIQSIKSMTFMHSYGFYLPLHTGAVHRGLQSLMIAFRNKSNKNISPIPSNQIQQINELINITSNDNKYNNDSFE